MIELKCTMEADLDNEVISKTYVRKFQTESITKEDLDQFFQSVKNEFIESQND